MIYLGVIAAWALPGIILTCLGVPWWGTLIIYLICGSRK